MAVRMTKAWQPLDARNVAAMTGHLGVYQLADDAGAIVYIGRAGGRSRYGLKGELETCLADPPHGASRFRAEVNQMYHSRHIELLAAYLHDHGRLPVGNADLDTARIGRIRPYGGS